MANHLLLRAAALTFLFASACSPGGVGGPDAGGGPGGPDTGPPDNPDIIRQPPTAAACDPGPSGSGEVQEPELLATLADRYHEAWLGSPAVADLDGDGVQEIIVPRGDLVLGWHLDGEIVFRAQVRENGRIWASPIVADLDPDRPGLEVAVASREQVYVWDASGTLLPGFPVSWQDEIRALAAGDIDGDGRPELVAVSTGKLEANGQRDIIMAWHLDGSPVAGFPPNTGGSAGCDEACYVTGGYDQNIALGDLDGDGALEIFATQDNAYLSLHDGTGRAFDANPEFEGRQKFLGVRFLHDYALARQGYADDESTALQAHFTNSAPAIADLDGDGKPELIVLGSVQNAAQDQRELGVALWVLRPDGSRPPAWTTPFHVPEYLAGLHDFPKTNVVGATNQVTVATLDPARPGPQLIFAGFDGRIHAVDAEAQPLWRHTYTTDGNVLTGGVVVADLSGDGIPEVIFTSYSPDEGKSHLFVLDAGGNRLHTIALPGRGAMPVPTVADVDGDGTLEIVVSLKDGEDRQRQVLVYTVPGSSTSCMPWATGRGNALRNGFVPPSR